MSGGYPGGGSNLVDILDRVLDKGLVVAGDIRISLANVELLTVRIRLLVCSIDKAEQIGLNWWRYDQSLVRPEGEAVPGSAAARALADGETIARLEARIAELETQLARSATSPPAAAAPAAPAARSAGAGATRRRARRAETDS